MWGIPAVVGTLLLIECGGGGVSGAFSRVAGGTPFVVGATGFVVCGTGEIVGGGDGAGWGSLLSKSPEKGPECDRKCDTEPCW